MTCRHMESSVCSLGLFGGRPSPGTCAKCDRYDGPCRGFGDVVHAVMTVSGVHAAVRKVVGDCGCGRRRARWNGDRTADKD